MTDDLKPMPDVIWTDSFGIVVQKEFYGGTKYVRADTIPAPEKIEGVQDILDQLNAQTELLDDDFDWSGFIIMFDGKHLKTIKRALIQAGAVDK